MATSQHLTFRLAAIGMLILTIGVAGEIYGHHTLSMNSRFDQIIQRADSPFSAKYRLDSLARQRDSLTNQMEAMQDKIDWLMKANNLLISQNKELQKKVSTLNTTLATKVPRSVITGDAFLVEATKANRKATAKAKKIRSLTISFGLPADIDLEKTKEIYLSLTNEQHRAMIPSLRTATITLPDVNEIIPVHAAQTVDFNRKPQRISFGIDPGTNLRPGIYRASVYTKAAYLGSVEFRLRDSFLFF